VFKEGQGLVIQALVLPEAKDQLRSHARSCAGALEPGTACGASRYPGSSLRQYRWV